jgi:hypothetical protein
MCPFPLHNNYCILLRTHILKTHFCTERTNFVKNALFVQKAPKSLHKTHHFWGVCTERTRFVQNTLFVQNAPKSLYKTHHTPAVGVPGGRSGAPKERKIQAPPTERKGNVLGQGPKERKVQGPRGEEGPGAPRRGRSGGPKKSKVRGA